MTTSSPNQVIGTSLLSTTISSVSASSVLVGPSTSVANTFGCSVALWFGRTTTTAPTVGVTFRLEKQFASSGLWVPAATYTTGIIVAVTGTMSSTSTNVQTIGSGGASFSVQGIVLLADGTTANSEWARLIADTATTLTFEDTLLNSHTTGSAYSQAEMYEFDSISLAECSNIRVVVDGSNHNQAFLCRVIMNTFTNVTNM